MFHFIIYLINNVPVIRNQTVCEWDNRSLRTDSQNHHNLHLLVARFLSLWQFTDSLTITHMFFLFINNNEEQRIVCGASKPNRGSQFFHCNTLVEIRRSVVSFRERRPYNVNIGCQSTARCTIQLNNAFL